METVLQPILANYSQKELVQICKGLNKSYNIYDSEEIRWDKIKYALYKTSSGEIEDLKKNELSNRIVNYLIFNYYLCERVIKYHFIDYLRCRHDHIVAFEMSVGESRIDICRINGCSIAYEIKTEYDTFDRLGSQMGDYIKTFDKVYVIVPKERVEAVKKIIPVSCGIIVYRFEKNRKVVFSYNRKALKNSCDIYMCIDSLSSSELSYLLKDLKLHDCRTRSEKKAAIMEMAGKKPIWKNYRSLLRHKYENQWAFITQHFSEILPIDIQSFFASNLSPTLFYKKLP